MRRRETETVAAMQRASKLGTLLMRWQANGLWLIWLCVDDDLQNVRRKSDEILESGISFLPEGREKHLVHSIGYAKTSRIGCLGRARKQGIRG